MLLSCYPDASVKYASENPITGHVFLNTNRFIHTSNDKQAKSGFIVDAQILPSEINQFAAQVQHPAKFVISGYPKVHVSCALNEDGTTRDVAGIAKVAAIANGQAIAETELGFTGIYTPGPNITLFASGDYLEWEE
jgi:hypothetical protein